MSIKPVLLVSFGIVFAGCRPSQSQAERDLLLAWSAPALTPKERAAVLDRSFTNGTPVATIVGLLGTDYIRVIPISAISLNGSPVMCWLEYTNQRVMIGTSARVGSGADPLTAVFTGAGYQLSVQPITNTLSSGQPSGAANQSKPVQSGTNLASAAAGSGR